MNNDQYMRILDAADGIPFDPFVSEADRLAYRNAYDSILAGEGVTDEEFVDEMANRIQTNLNAFWPEFVDEIVNRIQTNLEVFS